MIKKLLVILSMIFLVGCYSDINQNVKPSKQPISLLTVKDEIKYSSMMDDSDRNELALILEEQESGQTKVWSNKRTGISYVIKPTRNYIQKNGSICRHYTIDVYNNNETKKYYGKACGKDGSWFIIN